MAVNMATPKSARAYTIPCQYGADPAVKAINRSRICGDAKLKTSMISLRTPTAQNGAPNALKIGRKIEPWKRILCLIKIFLNVLTRNLH